MSDINFEKKQVRELGEKIGYGNLMSLASELWKDALKAEGYPESWAFVPKIEIKLHAPKETSIRSKCVSNLALFANQLIIN